MKNIPMLLACILCAGCAGTFDDPSAFTANPKYPVVTVTWVIAADPQKACGVDVGKGKVLLGCAIYSGTMCKIITSRNTTMEILGHELRHCFEGQFHQ